MESFDLKQAYLNLESANSLLKNALQEERSPEIFLAGNIRHVLDGDSHDPIRVVCNSLCMMWYEDRKFPFIEKEGGGFIIVSDNVIALANKLNDAKSLFRGECKKASNGGRSTAKSTLKEEAAGRNKELDARLKALGLNQLALWRCYKKITILENEARCIGWTWQQPHTYVKELTKEAALKICAKHKDDDREFDLWKQTIESVPDSKQIVLVRDKEPQLRVNISFEKSLKKDKVQIPSPSIILMSKSIQKNKPNKYRWRSLDDINTLSTNRSDKIIGNLNDSLGFLSLFAYNKPKVEGDNKCET